MHLNNLLLKFIQSYTDRRKFILHTDGVQTWVVGLVNSETNDIRLETVDSRDHNTLKTIIEKHVGIGNYIITDSLNVYHFLGHANSQNIHHIFNHGRGQFGHGLDSTSRIEGV